MSSIGYPNAIKKEADTMSLATPMAQQNAYRNLAYHTGYFTGLVRSELFVASRQI
jgi:hypothetical protein